VAGFDIAVNDPTFVRVLQRLGRLNAESSHDPIELRAVLGVRRCQRPDGLSGRADDRGSPLTPYPAPPRRCREPSGTGPAPRARPTGGEGERRGGDVGAGRLLARFLPLRAGELPQALDHLGQALPLDELHGVEVDAPLTADVKNRHDVRMVQLRGRPGLVFETL